MSKLDVIAAVVTYHTETELLKKCLQSFERHKYTLKVVVVDNSSNKELKSLVESFEYCEYIHSENNIGFGKANNIAFHKYQEDSKYFLFINPDVYFNPNTIESIIEVMESQENVCILAPKILFPDGRIQPVAKRLPDPSILFLRRFTPRFIKNLFKKKLEKYELLDQNLDENLVIPSASGCFLFFRTSVLKKINGFDDRFFMYMEDLDISRRARDYGQILYYPQISIFHKWARGAHSSLKLTFVMISSVIKYFLKWGWFFDHKREELNVIKRYKL